jgi:nitroreductase
VSAAELFAARYGATNAPTATIELPEAVELILRHRTVRQFTDQPVSDDHLTALIAAAQSAPSSSNQQAYSIIEVRDELRKERLRDVGRGSAFLTEAPVILLFVADWARHSQIAMWAGEPSVTQGYLESTLVGAIDAALAAQNLVTAASALGMGTCYLGSLRNEPDFMAEEFGLPDGAVILFGLALGWPDPTEPAGIKPRLPQKAVWHAERYRATELEDIEAYSRALADYYAPQIRPHTWVEFAISRMKDLTGLKGRERMREAFARRGLPSN